MLKILFSFVVLSSAQAQTSVQTEAGVPEIEPCNCGLADGVTPREIQKFYLKTRNILPEIYSDPKSALCDNFYENACSKAAPVDPTGSARSMLDTLKDDKFFQQDAELMKKLSAEWKSMGPLAGKESEQDYVVRKFMETHNFEKRLKRFEQILYRAKADILEYFENNFSPQDVAAVKDRLSEISVNRNYKDKPGLLFENTVYASKEIGVGGAFLRTVESEYAVYFVLAHELGHLVSDLGDANVPEVKGCIRNRYEKVSFIPGTTANLDEIWADWFASQIFDIRLKRDKISKEEKIAASKNALRYFCGYGGSKFGHPNGIFRINSFVEHDGLQQQICPEGSLKKGVACEKRKK